METTFQTLERKWIAPARERTVAARARVAVAALFFINGVLTATWISRIPAVQAQRGLGNGALGLALLCLAGGAVASMPLAGALSARLGSANVCRVAALAFCALLPLLALAPDTPLFIAALFAFGAAHGAMDVSMNAQAVAAERRCARPIMSSFHALFSSGGLAGAATGGLLASLELRPLAHFAILALAGGGAALLIFPHLLYAESDEPRDIEKGPAFPLPSRGLLALGAIALCCMMGEGAMADWTGVYLKTVIHTTEGLAAAGYAAFSLAMLAGRFAGDALAARIEPVRIVRLGGALAAAGLTLALLSTRPALALAGFAGVGAGFSTVVPMVFSAAGRHRGVTPGVALASVSTLGYFGFLAGPPFIGFLAELAGLRGALGIVVLSSLLILALARSLREK